MKKGKHPGYLTCSRAPAIPLCELSHLKNGHVPAVEEPIAYLDRVDHPGCGAELDERDGGRDTDVIERRQHLCAVQDYAWHVDVEIACDGEMDWKDGRQ